MAGAVILVVGQNSVWQKLCLLPALQRGGVNRVREVREYASGKGVNVARALASMGAPALVLGYAGGLRGRMFAEDLRAEGIRGTWTLIEEQTRRCITLAEEDGHSTEIIEPTPRASAAEAARFRRAFGRAVRSARFLVVTGTAVLGESDDCYAALIREARMRLVPALLDAACPAALRALDEHPEILKVNATELGTIAGSDVHGMPERIRAYARLRKTYGMKWIMATDGAEGIEGFDGERLIRAVPPTIRPVKTIGGGDAAAAGIILSVLERGWNLESALISAAALGTASCLNAVGGKVSPADVESIRGGVTVREIPGA